MKPTIKKSGDITCHRDGTVSYWSVYTRTWSRRPAEQVPDRDLATMDNRERARIARMARMAEEV
jgi:hypothetical protein